MTALPLVIRPEHPDDVQAIERLHARAFGPGRFARTAYRLREGAAALPELCFTALVGTYLVGSLRIGPAEAGGRPLLALGPITVDPSFANRGIGCALMQAGLDAARAGGHGLVVLVGDLPYYRRFGFSPVPMGRIVLPGPVDPARFLWLQLADGACEGMVGAVIAARVNPSPSAG
ncbi:GNAT family N-acetyltransferase [Methylobacterium haplocladii]|uniref:N-acetyltransferase n=1 Tax=Methylobacterium haplocladii TaxID=1176176 RepID=A0A512IMR0_9HYPH|nr:N-acetyltransferase [Methylobacterium haplocladii]GEO98994.1 N-acetyltransferase [Methylobacterium haplocladii]GJD84159.1 N-acetyltransferase Eis [Methylobacterium haplocladii]GLS61292.1 N-acetyltransferase [Methylobacterium haplocladii]